MAIDTKTPVPVASAAFLTDLQTFARDEDAARYRDHFADFVVSGGIHGTVAGLTGNPGTLLAYVRGYVVNETATITYIDNKTTHVIASSDTIGDLGVFTRVPGTNYLTYNTLTTQPALPSGCIWLMRVVTAGGAITAVTDLRNRSPIFYRIGEVVNVKEFGATGLGVADESAAILAAINALPSGGVVYFPPGIYLVGTKLTWTIDNITFLGAGREVTTIREHSSLGNNPIIELIGTAGDKITGTQITGLTIRNGTTTTGAFTSGRDGIKAHYVDRLTVEDCSFTEIQGAYGIKAKWSTNVNIRRNRFYKWAYAATSIQVESENIWFTDNWLSTAMDGVTAQHYAFHQGNDTTSEGTFGVRNLWVLRNVFDYDSALATSRWHPINSHGGENIWIAGNTIRNWRAGINVALSTAHWSNPVLKNVWITDNFMDRGTATTAQNAEANGILVQGTDWSRDGDFHIIHNTLIGMGQALDGSIPISEGINVAFGRNIHIIGNTIRDYRAIGIRLATATDGARVLRNTVWNCVEKTSGSSYGIYGASGGLYRILIDENVIGYDDETKNITVGISISGFTGHVIVGARNRVQADTTPVGGANWGYASDPTTKYWMANDLALGTWGNSSLAGFKRVSSTSPQFMYGWFDAAMTATGSGTNGQKTFTLTTPADYPHVPQGARVVITNGASGPSNLTTTVLKVSTAGVLTLADALGNTVTDTAIAMVAPTFSAP